MAALSSVQLKLDALERIIRTNTNSDTMQMVQLVTEIRVNLNELYITNGLKTEFNYFKEINELNDTEIIENTELEKRLHEQLEERCHPLPVCVQNVVLSDTNVDGFSFEDRLQNFSDFDGSNDKDSYRVTIEKITLLKDLMYKNTMDTSLFDYVDTFMKGIREKPIKDTS